MIIEGYDISLLYLYNREAEEGIKLSLTPAGYVYHFSPPAEPQPISLSLRLKIIIFLFLPYLPG